MRFLTLSLFLFLCKFSIAQSLLSEKLRIEFVPTFNHQKIVLDEVYYTEKNDSIVFETFRFYVSNICLFNDDKIILKDKSSPHLIDLSNESTLAFSINHPKQFNAIRFNLGIDSTTNVSGALGGDLDPAKGMYWTWQSGYINLKLEGKSSLCPTRKNAFEFHLGGYNGLNNAIQTVILNTGNVDAIRIEISLDEFLKNIDLLSQNAVMIPGKEAVKLSKLMAQTFSILTK